MTGTCDSEKPRQARAIPKTQDRHVRFRKTTTGTAWGTRKSHGMPNAKTSSLLYKLIKHMDWKKTVCDFVIFRGAAVVQLLGIETTTYKGKIENP